MAVERSTEQTGRTQLRDVLDDLVSQRKDRELSNVEIDEDVEEAARDLIEYSSPRKRTYKQRRKRKRAQRDSISDTFSDEEKESSSSEVITIYGRHLNLSRLGNTPSLYSVCREWVVNDPLGQGLTVHSLSFNTHPMVTVPDLNVYSLPFPEVSDNISYADDRPLVDTDNMDHCLDVGLTNDEMDPLKRDYLQKWKDVRTKWKRLSKESQQRHSESYKILQELCQR